MNSKKYSSNGDRINVSDSIKDIASDLAEIEEVDT